MLENQESPAVGPTMDELKAAIAGLEQQLEWAKTARDNYGKTIDQIRSHIQNSIDREEWSDEELDEIFWEELAEMLDLEISKTVEVIIKAEWSATIKMKRGKDLDYLDFEVSEPDVSGAEMDSVYERSLTVDEV